MAIPIGRVLLAFSKELEYQFPFENTAAGSYHAMLKVLVFCTLTQISVRDNNVAHT